MALSFHSSCIRLPLRLLVRIMHIRALLCLFLTHSLAASAERCRVECDESRVSASSFASSHRSTLHLTGLNEVLTPSVIEFLFPPLSEPFAAEEEHDDGKDARCGSRRAKY